MFVRMFYIYKALAYSTEFSNLHSRRIAAENGVEMTSWYLFKQELEQRSTTVISMITVFIVTTLAIILFIAENPYY